MSTAVRYTPQKKQELRSRHQLADRLTEFGWVPVVPEDLGEDFIVHIYHEGRATGVNFFVQLKSVTNLNDRRKGNSLPYSFEVKDLLHWEKFTLPVALIVWDVKLHEGRWALVEDAIKQLDKDDSSWRQQKTKTVYLPWDNGLNGEGLAKLRKAVGKKFFPLIFSEKPQSSQIKLTFPTQNEQDEKNWGEFNNYLDFGKKVTLKSVQTQFDFSQLQKIWLDLPESGLYDITVGPRTSSKEYTLDIAVVTNNKLCFLNPTKFKATAIGQKTITISNEHQLDNPLHFTFTFDKENNRQNTEIKLGNFALGLNLASTRNVLQFMKALAKGGRLQLTFRELDNKSLSANFLPIPDIAPNQKFADAVEKLCGIQEATGTLFTVSSEGFSVKDIETIDEVSSIILQGKITKIAQSYKAEILNQEISIGDSKDNLLNILAQLRKQNLPIQLTLTTEESEFQILNRTIKMGRQVQYLDCKIATPTSVFKHAVEAYGPDEALEVDFEDVMETNIFPQWFKHEAKRISQLLAEKFYVNKVYLFGSLAWGNKFSPETDIDLAVSGLHPEQIFKAIGYLEHETKYPFDLADLDSLTDSLKERILREGKLLYEREPIAIGG